MNAVADAGPLIHLHEIHCLELLSIFDSILVPDLVLVEALAPGRISAEAFGNIPRFTVTNVDAAAVAEYSTANSLGHLQAGELAALAVCAQTGTDILLTDDLAVRKAASELKRIPVGSIGIIARSYRDGKLAVNDAEERIRALHQVSSLFVTPALIELAIRELRGIR